MKRRLGLQHVWMRSLLISSALICLLSSVNATAGVYAQRLTNCVLSATTEQDKQILIQRFFLIFSSSTALKDLVNISEHKQEGIRSGYSETFTRLFSKDCQTQTEDAMNFEGKGALVMADQMLIRELLKGFMADPTINKGLVDVGQEIIKIVSLNAQSTSPPLDLGQVQVP